MKAYWSREASELLCQLDSSETGLTQEQADLRLRQNGENRLTDHSGTKVLQLLRRQFANPLVLILVFGASVSLVLGEWTEAITILLIVLGSTLIGFVQEYRANNAIQKLRESLALKVSAIRDGKTSTVDATQIVSGDVIELSAGNLVPADGILLEARDFLVSQAALTGESFPVEKFTGVTRAVDALPQRTNAVFLGTSVRSGTARMLVVQIGASTEFGAIAGRLAAVDEETDFAKGIRKFGYLLTRVMMFIVIFVIGVNLLMQRPPIDSLLFAVALAVGLTPELLPAIISVTLSVGARQMAKDGVIVRRVEAIENLGSVDVLCTDKTGTLTQGVVELNGAIDPFGASSDRVFQLAAINSRLESGIANPLDVAIVQASNTKHPEFKVPAKIDEIPYDFIRKRMTIVVHDDSARHEHLMITKGAFANVIACCDQIAWPDGLRKLDGETLSRLQTWFGEQGANGFRVLGVATRKLPVRDRHSRDDEVEMVFEGFLSFFDPLKEDIEETIQEFARLGISIKVITGDNRYVAAHVGEAVGLDATRILTGEELRLTRSEALGNLVEQVDIFAEIDPQQKEQIVHALQRRGHAVAYMGDGINDAPALRAADVGISVDQAVDVARESADIVLLQRDLRVLHDGIVNGRKTFTNTLKYIAITTSANFGNMISMAAATLFLPYLPLLAKQILLNNFLSDFPSMAISTDNVDPESTEFPQRWDIGRIQSFMIVFGLISTVFDLALFAILLWGFHAAEGLFQTSWFVVSLLTELAVVLVLRTHLPAWKSRPGFWLVVTTLIVAVVAIGLPWMGGVARLFSLQPIPIGVLLTGLTVVAAYIAATEFAKQRFFHYTVKTETKGSTVV